LKVKKEKQEENI